MAELATIARPYAEAIFRLAKQANTLPAWSDELGLIVSVYPIIEPEYGWLPTPRAAMAKHGICWKRAEDGEPKGNLEDYLAYLYVKSGGKRIRGLAISASFETLMMGWPQKWAKCTPLEMDKYQSWLQQHSNFYQEV